MLVGVLLFLVSCSGLKKTSTPQPNPKDSAKVGVVSDIDSATNSISNAIGKVGDFFNGIIPGLLAKDSTILINPRPTIKPSVEIEPKGKWSFPQSPVQRKLSFDSTQNVTLHDEFVGADINQPQTYTIQQYIQQQREQGLRDGLTKSAINHVNETNSGGGDTKNGNPDQGGQGVLSDYGHIEIPIPPSIVPTIFGKPSINLRVNGDVAIHLAYRDNQFLQTTGAAFSGSETGLDFRQEVNMNISGSIGDKVQIKTDFGSLRQFSFDNLFKLSYKGYPEEIIQSVEAGNVSLVTPSKYIGTQSALFGFKGVMRFGPVYVTALAAQKKGERQSKSFGGGPGSTTQSDFAIQPANFRKNMYFLDTLFMKDYERYYSTIPPQGLQDVIVDRSVEVWRSTNSQAPKKISAYVWYNLPPILPGGRYPDTYKSLSADQRNFESGYVEKLDTSQYSVNPVTGVITLYQEPSDYDFIAVSYRTPGSPGNQYGDQVGNGQDTSIVLKLLKPKNLFADVSKPSWTNLLKNGYYVGATNIDQKNFSVKIAYTFPTGQVYEYVRSATGLDKAITVTGLDRYDNATQTLNPDGQFDVNANGAVSPLLDSRTGTLIFPYLQPFGDRIIRYQNDQVRKNGKYRRDSTFYFPDIYHLAPQYFTTSNSSTYQSAKNSQISINVKYAGGTSSVINLNAFNIVEGSIRVTAAGRTLVEGEDYRVDVNGGTVTLLKPDLATAGAINVEYDTHDIFTTSTKSVLGLRAEMPILDRGLVGLSFMNYSMRLPTIKTRQGEEPLSNWIIGGDASYKIPFPTLTNWMNALPIFNLREKSEVNFKLDAALSLPNPNTQKSPMAVDNNASIAYLDDYEGGRNVFGLNTTYGRWKHSSQPVNDNFSARGLTVDEVNARKAKMYWYQPYPNDVRITDIKPNKSVSSANEQAQVLDVVFDPQNWAGIYNHYPDQTEAPENRWAGMTQYSQGLNVLATNTDAIEFWMNIADAGGHPTDGVIHFDMGRMSEDVIPDGKLETEDKNNNGRYDPGEDVGLDTLSTDQEKGAYPAAANPPDPNNDNYSYDQNSSDYTNINGTEGNEQDRVSGYTPDTEDLDGDLSVNQDNNYYEYEIPINPINNPYIVGNTNNTWYQFRVPITAFKKIVGTLDTSFANISYYRMWFSGFSKQFHARFYDIGLVGSQWTRGKEGLSATNPLADTSFQVSYVNIEDNSGAPTNYTPPPGAQRDRLAGQASTVLANEQSLNLQLKCVPSNSKREAVRVFQSPNDLFNYRSMAVWVHGDETMPTAITTVADTLNKVWVYFRFGTDKYNYYQYRRPLTKDWQNIHIDFATLSALKATKRVSTDTVSESANDGFLGSQYTVVGSPNITNAPVFTMGVENQTGSSCLTTDVWFDELRLLDANDKTDFAVNGNVQLKLAEFGLVTANFIHENPDFHRVDERFNTNRALNSGWGITGEFRMEKILPTWLEKGTKFPLTISHSETLLSPKYVPNTDVLITTAIAKINESVGKNGLTAADAKILTDSIQLTNEFLTVRNSIGATGVQFTFPGSFFLLPALINRLVYGFGYGEEFTRTPVYEYYRNWSWTGSILYDVPYVPSVSLSPLTWVSPSTFDIGRYSQYKINFLPQRFTLSASVTRSRLHYLNRSSTLQFFPDATAEEVDDILRSRVPFINRSLTANRLMSFSWKLSENGLISPTFDYTLEVSSNLTPFETYSVNNRPDNSYDSVYFYQQPFSHIMNEVFFKDGALVRPGKDFFEQQKVRITTNPRLPWILWIDKFIRPVFSYNVDYKWSDAQTHLQNSKTGQWNNVITAGLDFNLKELGLDIFGPDQAKPVQRGRPGAKAGQPNENPNQQGFVDPYQPEQPIQPQNPGGRLKRVGDVPGQKPIVPIPQAPLKLDPSKKGDPTATIPPQIGRDTLPHIIGVGAEGLHDDLSVSDTVLMPIAPPELPKEELVDDEPFITPRDIAKALIQKPFLDWTGTKFTFTQTNYSLNGALQGNGPGISNFLTKGIFSPETDDNGPSRAYQMGLITDPHGRLLIKFVPQFPFVKFGVRHGLREGNILAGQSVDINDVFTQKNTLEFQTSRSLWTGANINFNWRTEFTYDERDALRIGSDGSITPQSIQKTGDVSRTFLSIPPLPFLNISQSGIQRVGEKWIEKTSAAGANTDAERDALAPRTKNQIQVESFMQGFETLPFFSGVLREYLPRLNYSFSWSGLEKFPLFAFCDRATFRHGYSGNYKRTFKLNPGDSIELTTLQTVAYGFRPLIALDLGWDKVWGGKLSSSLNYDTQTEWASDYSFNRITKRLSTTFGITANFQKQGVTIPFLKLNLKNNFGLSFNFSQTISNDLYYTFNTILTNPDGTSNGGITKTSVEPRFSYDINQQLTIEGFYRYERTTPAAAGVLVPPTRTITAGFDIRLKVF